MEYTDENKSEVISEKEITKEISDVTEIDLDESISRVTDVFNTFQNSVEAKISEQKQIILLQESEIKNLKKRNGDLMDSLSQVNIVPDEHVFSMHIKMLRKKTSDLLEEAILFRHYSDELLAKYSEEK